MVTKAPIKDGFITMRIDKVTHRKLKAIAKRKRRYLSNLMHLIMAEYVERDERTKR